MKLIPGHYYHVVYDDPENSVVLGGNNIHVFQGPLPTVSHEIDKALGGHPAQFLEQVIFIDAAHTTELMPASLTGLQIQDGCYYKCYVLAQNCSGFRTKENPGLCSLTKCRVVMRLAPRDFPMFISFSLTPWFEKILKGEEPAKLTTAAHINFIARHTTVGL
jgi:hypothetical protein